MVFVELAIDSNLLKQKETFSTWIWYGWNEGQKFDAPLTCHHFDSCLSSWSLRQWEATYQPFWPPLQLVMACSVHQLSWCDQESIATTSSRDAVQISVCWRLTPSSRRDSVYQKRTITPFSDIASTDSSWICDIQQIFVGTHFPDTSHEVQTENVNFQRMTTEKHERLVAAMPSLNPEKTIPVWHHY